MTDQEFLDAFESCALTEEQFHHRDHLRIAWILLRRLPLLEAIGRFTDDLKRFAASLGKAGLYHETITWAYLLLVHERIRRDDQPEWDAFCAANPDLFRWKPSILDDYYRKETLASELARKAFVMPDKAA